MTTTLGDEVRDVVPHGADAECTVQVISGMPNFVAVRQIQAELLADAGSPSPAALGDHRTPSPTTFHVACDRGGRALGVASSVVGPFAELPLGLAMAAHGLDLPGPDLIADPTCELVSMSIAQSADLGHVDGCAEAMYRSVYQRAIAARAESIAIGVEPWLLDVLRDEYGIPFRPLGPCFESSGRSLIPAGGRISDLREGIERHNPSFAAYLGAELLM